MMDSDFEVWWTNARERLDEIERDRQKLEKTEAPRFNMFRALGVQNRELSHSSFLANLLNPQGEHGQGLFFLESFFGYLRDGIDVPAPMNVFDNWTVTTEHPCGAFGRIDILIRSKTRHEVVAIENKIWARDAEGQIARYARWLDTLAPKPEALLLYLTLEGESARAADGLYHPISYKDHIIPWLEKLEESALELPVHVAQAISQYKWTLNMLTGGAAMPTEQSLIDFLARTENVGYAERIAQAFPGVQRTLEQTVLTKIVQRIEGDASDLGWRVVPPTIGCG